jgi:aromatic ring-opening dioxygenase catalytic subunit (LigB family)
MAEIVAAFGVPHTPAYPKLVEREGPDCKVAQMFRAVREHLEAVQPDIVLVFDSDHINTFFFDNWPTFLVGTAPEFEAPNDESTGLPRRTVTGHEALGRQVYTSGISDGFDLSLSRRFDVDHSVLVPLHFLTPDMQMPVVPLFINGLAPPLPAAKRCFALGQAVRAAVDRWPVDARVAILASGSFSLDLNGLFGRPGSTMGVPDPEWVKRVARHLANATIPELLEEATSEQLARAGNIGGEVLNWIALLGTLDRRKAAFVEPDAASGHAYAAWRWD